MLLKARYAGLREYHGEVVAPGTWKPIVAVLTDPVRRNTPNTRRKWLLSGLAFCHFGAPSTRAGRSTYECSATRHLARDAEPIDELVRGLTVGRLSRPDAADLLVAHDRPDVERSMAKASRADVLGSLVNASDPGRVWNDMEVDRRRAVVDALMTIRLLAPGRGARVFDPETVDVTWRTP